MRLLKSKKPEWTAETRRAHTSVRFSVNDVTALAELLVAGQALLRQTGPVHPVVGRLKAAMTRLHAPIPHGLSSVRSRNPRRLAKKASTRVAISAMVRPPY